MPIRVRLIISYIMMLLVPVILLPVAALAIGAFYFDDIQSFYGLNQLTVRRLIQEDLLTYEEIKNTAFQNPDRLLNKTYLAQLDQKLITSKTGLVVRKGNQIVYTSERLSKNNVVKQLPAFGYYRGFPDEYNHHRDHQQGELDKYSIRQFDFYFKDQSPGSVFLVTNIGPLERFIEDFFDLFLFVVVLILVITCGTLTFLMGRSIAKPIETLKEATLQIKEGNLDCAVEHKSSDEIGQLYDAFEEMRLQLKESVEMRLQYEENRKELISNISHDLKTPVTAIKGYIEGIMDGVADSPEKIDKYIQVIHSKADDMDHLIDELLLFSKLDVGKEPFNFETVDIKQYLQDQAEELQLDLDKKGIKLEVQIEPTPVPLIVIADREKIKRVIQNIVENAAKYMNKPNGLVVIALYDMVDSVIIEIRDNGPGIPDEALPQVFQRFYQADSSRSKGGTGLGLAIARRIIEEHGGRIWIENVEPTGSKVFISLNKASR